MTNGKKKICCGFLIIGLGYLVYAFSIGMRWGFLVGGWWVWISLPVFLLGALWVAGYGFATVVEGIRDICGSDPK